MYRFLVATLIVAGASLLALQLFVSLAPAIVQAASVSITPSSAWYNNDFLVSHTAWGADVCRLETKNGSAGWVDRGTISCSATSTNIQVPSWCDQSGAGACGVRIVASKSSVTVPSWFSPGAFSWTVPPGVTEITVELWGAQAQDGGFSGGKGGLGGYIKTRLKNLTPTETLRIYVGGSGWSGGFNGGGSGGSGSRGRGGGASDIRRGGDLLNDRIVVAGGGGGGSNRGHDSGTGTAIGVAGGRGGNLTGQSGQRGRTRIRDRLSSARGGAGGTGGTQNRGGLGGSGRNDGGNGSFGIGGTGGAGTASRAGSGGGGGGGYYGGGGGGSGSASCCDNAASGGGGGGGSSFSSGTGTTYARGIRSDNGQIVISYTPSGESQDQKSFNIDRLSPELRFNSPANNTPYTGDFKLNYDCTDAHSGISGCWLQTKNAVGTWVDRTGIPSGNGRIVTINTTSWCPNFQCAVRIRAVDKAGNPNISAWRIYPAQASVNITSSPLWYNQTFQVKYSALNATICTIQTNNGGAGWVKQFSGSSFCGSGKTVDIQVPSWCSADGAGECQVRVTAGAAQGTQGFNIDLTAPQITRFEATDGTNTVDITTAPLLTAAGSVTIQWDTTDGPAGSGIKQHEVWRSEDGGANWTNLTSGGLSASTTSYEDTSPLSGSVLYGLHVKDNAALLPNENCIDEQGLFCGNGVTSDSVTHLDLGPLEVIFDNIPPVVTFTPPTPAAESVHSEAFDIGFNATDNLSVAPDLTCELFISNNGGAAWNSRKNIGSCGLGQTETILASWCKVAGAKNCGVRIEAKDALNNMGFAERLFTFNQEPTLTIPGSLSQVINDPPLLIDAQSSDDNFLGPLTFSWDTPSAGASFNALNIEDPTVTFTNIGTFTFRLTINDGFFSVSETVEVEITHEPPVVTFISADQSINFGLPTVTASVSGDARDDGFRDPLTYLWVQMSGPSASNIVSETSKITDIIFNASGTYVFEFRAFDGDFWNVTPVLTTVTVVNAPPTVSAGTNQSLDFPSFASLTGTATDDNLPNLPDKLTYKWTQVSGTGDTTFGDNEILSTTADFTQAGVYILRLTVSDGELSTFNEVIINFGGPEQYGLVPCGLRIDDPDTPWKETDPCGVCHTFALVNNVVQFFLVPNDTNQGFAVVLLLGMIALVAGGFMLLVGGLGNPALRNKGRTIIFTAIIALLIIYGSWVVIELVLDFFGVTIWAGPGPWWQVTCQ